FGGSPSTLKACCRSKMGRAGLALFCQKALRPRRRTSHKREANDFGGGVDGILVLFLALSGMCLRFLHGSPGRGQAVIPVPQTGFPYYAKCMQHIFAYTIRYSRGKWNS